MSVFEQFRRKRKPCVVVKAEEQTQEPQESGASVKLHTSADVAEEQGSSFYLYCLEQGQAGFWIFWLLFTSSS